MERGSRSPSRIDGGRNEGEHPDRLIVELAERQHGVVGRHQLIAMGIGREAIRRRVDAHRLHRVHKGVYAVGHLLLSDRGRYLAAVLTCGHPAVLSHASAADLWQLRPSWSARVHVTVPRGRAPAKRTAVCVYETRFLPGTHVTARHGIPATTPARTLLDLAATLSPKELERAVERAEVLRIFDGFALVRMAAQANGRRGAGVLRRILEEMAGEPLPLRSELERRFLHVVTDAGLPAPVVNARIGAHEVDFHWPGARLIVETDGRATHDTAHAFERDRRRDLDLTLAGWHVIRISWRQVMRNPDRIAAMLRARL
jgi:predicted transcriptional regulator of viral defense system